MGYLLLGICAVTSGALIVAAPLAALIVRNRRRIERLEGHIGRLERRQDAHGVVIRHLAEENVEPDGPDPPPQTRPALRVIKGGAAGVGLLAVLRAHPARTAIATGSVATATALAVTLAVSQPPPGVSVQGATPPGAAMSVPAPTSPLGVVTSSSPSPAASIAAPTPNATMATATAPIVTASTITVAVDLPAPRVATAVPTRTQPHSPPPPTAPSSAAAPTPSATDVGPTATPSPTPAPTLGPARPCAISVVLLSLLHLCVL